MLSTPKASAGRGRSSSLAGSSGAPTPKSRKGRRGTSTWRPGEELAIPRGNSFSTSMSRSRNSPIAALSSPKNGEGNQLMMNRSQSEFSSTAGGEDNEGEEDDVVHNERMRKQQAEENEAATAARINLLQKLNVSKLPARVTTTPDHSRSRGNGLHSATDETTLSAAAVSDTTSLASGGQQTAVAGVNATHHHPSSKQPPRGVEVTSTAASALRREYSSSVLARLAAAKQAAVEQADHDTGVEDDDEVSIVSAGSQSRSKEDRKTTRKSHTDQFVAQATPSVVGILPDGRHIVALDTPGTAAPATELGDTDAAIVGGPQGAEYFAMSSVGHPTVNMAKRTILSVPPPSLATRKKPDTAAGMMRSGGGGRGGGQKLLGSMGRVNNRNSSSSSGGANILATVERQTQFLDSVTTQDTSTTVTTSEVKTPISVQNPDLVTTAKTIVQVKKTTIRTVTRSAIDGPTPVGSLKVTRERPRSALSLTGTGGGSSSATRPGSASLRQPSSIRSQSPATSDSRHRKGNGPADTIMTDLLLSPTLIDGIDGKQRESQFTLATEEEDDDDNNSKEPKGFSVKAANPSTSSVVIRNYAPQGLSCTSSASGGGILNSDESGNSPSRGTQGSDERFLTTRQEVLLSSDVDQEEKEDPSTSYHGKNPTTNILVRLEPRQSLENATSPLNGEGMHPHLQASLARSSIRPRQGHPGLINGQIQQQKETEKMGDIVRRRRRDHHQQISGKRTVASLGMGICHFPSGFGNKTKAKQLAQQRSSEQRFRF